MIRCPICRGSACLRSGNERVERYDCVTCGVFEVETEAVPLLRSDWLATSAPVLDLARRTRDAVIRGRVYVVTRQDVQRIAAAQPTCHAVTCRDARYGNRCMQVSSFRTRAEAESELSKHERLHPDLQAFDHKIWRSSQELVAVESW